MAKACLGEANCTSSGEMALSEPRRKRELIGAVQILCLSICALQCLRQAGVFCFRLAQVSRCNPSGRSIHRRGRLCQAPHEDIRVVSRDEPAASNPDPMRPSLRRCCLSCRRSFATPSARVARPPGTTALPEAEPISKPVAFGPPVAFLLLNEAAARHHRGA